jgi:predicted nucleotidyltransferase
VDPLGAVHLPDEVERAVADLRRYARLRFGLRLRQLTLFGSYARGEGVAMESDVDVLVVVEGMTEAELMEIVSEGAVIGTRHNVVLVPLAMEHARYEGLRRQDRLLVREIARDGIAL